MPFNMPMFRSFVPKKIQPWIYVLTVFCIQFSGGVYLGALEAVRGTTALMIEDLLMLLYTGLAGMAVWFPMLFRMKFRFTNQQLLITSAIVIAICNFITMHTTNMAILMPVCFISGIAKIQGTFECMSNIQLWITPPRDFAIFFPVLHIVLLTAITGSAWLAAVIAYHFTWQMMHVFTIGTMCFVVLTQLLLCQPWCPMPQRMPLRGIDITTGLLISLLMLMISYFLVYGDYLMWLQSPRLRWILALSLILLSLILYRLKTIEKPYISLRIFRYKNVLAILLVTAVAELLLGAEHTLEEIYWTEVRGLEEHTKTALCLWSLPGVYIGVLINQLRFSTLHDERHSQTNIRTDSLGRYIYDSCFPVTRHPSRSHRHRKSALLARIRNKTIVEAFPKRSRTIVEPFSNHCRRITVTTPRPHRDHNATSS